MKSLILSRLLFNVHVAVLKGRDLKAFNGVYMRVLRRIHGDIRFCAEVEFTDLQIRAVLRQPSVDCLIAHARLRYAGRIARLRPRDLLGLLHLRKNGNPLPWVRALSGDVELVRRSGSVPPVIGSLLDNAEVWHELMKDERAWGQIVSDLFFVESLCDKVVVENNSVQVAFACGACDKAFASQKALESHARAKHGSRLTIREHVANSICPCCKTDFKQRLRCIAHLSDRRRPRCADWVRTNCPRLSVSRLAELDVIDKELRRTRQQTGRPHHIAVLPVVSKHGKIIGRVA